VRTTINFCEKDFNELRKEEKVFLSFSRHVC
jgi:hypothetical protein